MSKIDVFLDLVFGGILGRFWEGFGTPKTSMFDVFRCFFDVIFEARFEEAKNCKKTRQEHRRLIESAWAAVVPRLLGRTKEGL